MTEETQTTETTETTETQSTTTDQTSQASKEEASKDAQSADKQETAKDDKDESAKDKGQLLFDEDQSKDDKDKDTESEEEKDSEGTDQQEKINYEYEVPEEFSQMTEQDASYLNTYAQKHNLSQDAAQELVDKYIDKQVEQHETWVNTITEWRKQTEDDPEIGGQNLQATTNRVRSAIKQYSSNEEHLGEITNVMKNFGLGNNPHVIRLINNMALALEDDSIGKSNSPGGEDKKSHAEILFGKSSKAS